MIYNRARDWIDFLKVVRMVFDRASRSLSRYALTVVLRAQKLDLLASLGIRSCGRASLYKTLVSMPHPPPHGDKRDNGSVIGHSTKRALISIMDPSFCH